MKRIGRISSTLVVLLGGFLGMANAHAHAGRPASGGDGITLTCSDPRLAVRFKTSEEASAYCTRFSTLWIDVGVTYDLGFGEYACSCYGRTSGGGDRP